MESKGFTVAVYNRTTAKVDAFVNGRGKDKKFVACHSPDDLVKALKKPRKIMMMVQAGKAVDALIDQLTPLLDEGDILIDGGNSFYGDSKRRYEDLKAKKLLFVGAGVSGGEEGALHGPSIMPGGAVEAWESVKPIFQGIAAKVESGDACCDWVGESGAGHYVKMVHNGIEYGDMQLIAEAYHFMREVLRMSNEEMSETFAEWNKGDLDSYLIEITRDILQKKDEEDSSKYVIDTIVDAAGQKGTGKWTAINALDFGTPVTLIAEAVFARCLSSLKDDRVVASSVLAGPTPSFNGDRKDILDKLGKALYGAKLVSYAQGYELMKAASREWNWKLNYGGIALMWRGGCIIRSKFLGKIKEAFDSNPQLSNLLLDPFFKAKVSECQQAWREVVASAMLNGIPVPAMSTALCYYDGFRTANLPQNMTQAQRDFFGAHTYEKVGKPRGQFFHTNWTGRGGNTASTAYNV
eukprot:CAMPEP_0177657938 /NCGR_PEP_ID=MMETSP0447-20121125/16514_1 /TAXON_ID=0 /ORGANISM="Stygamoeba regulata, Strain BSH-02190019" /LENGTH=464 /DNA_ID=CAMNT_0019162451 /DNA_START=94 /DNA_END=1488 /DNA_ORIENTATION=-